jgi:Tol biopolymer transport system component
VLRRNFWRRVPLLPVVRSVVRSVRIVALVGLLVLSAAPARAAFPGRNGVLAVELRGGDVALVRQDGQVERLLCSVAALCGVPLEPRWSPDGTRLVVVDGSGSRIEILGADGSCLWCLLGAPVTTFRGSRPAFTADGASVTFAGISRFGGWSVPLAGGSVSAVEGGRVADAVWSSRGELAFVRGGSVRVRSATGPRRARRLRAGAAPSWSPGGDAVALAGGGWVWVVQVRSGTVRRLTRGSAPAWSPDGRLIAYIGPGGDVRVIGAVGGRSRTLGLEGRSVDWQPLPREAPGGCRAPNGARVIVSTAQAVVDWNPGANGGNGGWYGCLRGMGRWRLLAAGTADEDGYDTALTAARLAGRFALLATSYSDKYFDCSLNAGLTDLATGASIPLVSQDCGDDVAVSGLDSFVVDSSGFAAWRSTTSTPLYEPLSAVACPSVSLCVAVDSIGDVATSTDPGGGRSAWSVADVARTTSFSSISCPAADLCVAVADGGGEVFTSTDPTGGAAAWAATAADTQSAPIFPAGDVSCPSVSLCVVADGTGNIATSADPAGPASGWSVAHVAGGAPPGLIGLSCASNSLCVALDRHGDVLSSINPTGGASDWATAQVEPSTTSFLVGGGVSCPASSLCVAVNGAHILATTDPTGGAAAWQDTTLIGSSSLSAVACPSTSLCVAVDTDGDVLTSTDPTGGASAWQRVDIDGSNSLTGISCPSVSRCVAVDDQGNVLNSTAPAAGSTAWSSTPVDVPGCALAGTPCAVEKLVAHDDHGTRLIDSTPPGSGTILSDVALSGNGLVLTWSHDGLAKQAPLG